MKIHHVAVTVNDLKESVDFYTQILGFEIARQFAREDMGAYAAFVKLEDFKIELWQFQDTKEDANSLGDIKVIGIRHIAFEVENLEETIQELSKKGLKFTKPKLGASGHHYSFSSDPNGVALEFYEK
ncbi:MAG: hypothetical protein COV59_02175 [Candidatus Magasanikbacteria bacterium CG11_big_fil_rev_8_21_14_0_20_39_34]|uniref:VOC domain-containing protein n=1 Tax=Candidatus Magasanikbacteria bacterium CG11_big_fil_rev_8_21_14_0_20_39_34 TaxID=1974653 RepID=A0A2H0N510_9BACT|nr:MAG: hypothetical protein COV59_02175 [Candidatus Magasanikbacteria bacterium CG11_big_fil_rev_8_21_14_0_20_39_34]